MAGGQRSGSRARPASESSSPEASATQSETQWVWNGNPLHLRGRILFAGDVLGDEDEDAFGDTWDDEVAAGRLVERPRGPAAEGQRYEAPMSQQQFVGSTQGGGADPQDAASSAPGSSGHETEPPQGAGGAGSTPEAPDAEPTPGGAGTTPAQLDPDSEASSGSGGGGKSR